MHDLVHFQSIFQEGTDLKTCHPSKNGGRFGFCTDSESIDIQITPGDVAKKLSKMNTNPEY